MRRLLAQVVEESGGKVDRKCPNGKNETTFGAGSRGIEGNSR